MTTIAAPSRAEREEKIAGFLQRTGWDKADRSLLAGDASFRRYDRLRMGETTAVLMDAPPPMERVGPFLKIAKLLHGRGFSVPRIFAEDETDGLLLIEDLGDDTYTRLLARGHEERSLYELATDALIEISRRVPGSALADLPAFDEARCLREVSLLLDWYWPQIRGAEVEPKIRSEFEGAWREVLPLMWSTGETITLFDFHIDNLLLLPGREGFRACGLLDFQDAIRGPVPFDLASLLEDVRRNVPAELATAMIERMLQARPDLDPKRFRTAYAVSAAQRNTRISGTFARLLKRDNKPAYQKFMPRVWELIAQDISHPSLAPVADWFARHLPPPMRRTLA